jgi:hypothetical protein
MRSPVGVRVSGPGLDGASTHHLDPAEAGVAAFALELARLEAVKGHAAQVRALLPGAVVPVDVRPPGKAMALCLESCNAAWRRSSNMVREGMASATAGTKC